MPIVKQYERQVQEAPLPAVRRQEYRIAQVEAPERRVAPTAESLGAGLGQQLGRVGEDLYAKQQAKNDEIRMLQADRDLGTLENGLLYDPKTGALNIQGEGAYGLPDSVGKTFTEGAAKIREGLANDRQRLAFDQHSSNVSQRLQGRIAQHVDEQRKTVEADALNGKVQNETQAAIADGTPERIASAVDSIRLAYHDHAMNPDGSRRIPQDVEDGASAKAVDRIHLGVIQRMLDNGQDIQAKVYYEHAQKEILGEHQGAIEKALKKETTLGDAQRIVDTLKPKYSEDMAQTDLEAEIPKLTNDPETRQRAEDLLGRWFQQRRSDTRFREQQASSSAKEKLDQAELQLKNTMDRANKRLDFDHVIPQSIRDGLSLPAEKALRSYWNDLADDKEPKTDPGVFYQLYSIGTAEATKDQFAKTNLMQYVNRLSRGDFSKLVELQGAIRKGDDKKTDELSLGYRNTNEMVQDSMRVLGLDPTPKDGTDEAKRLGRLHQAVDQDMQDWESLPQNKGKKPSKAEIQQMIDNHLIQGTVTTKGFFWDSKEQKYVIDTAPDDNFSLAVQQVPAEERRKIEAALLRAGVPQISEKMILDMYLKKIRKTK